MIYYHKGKPGEVSHASAEEYIREILANPFTTGSLLRMVSDASWLRKPDGTVTSAAGAMAQYLKAAELREATRGEG